MAPRGRTSRKRRRIRNPSIGTNSSHVVHEAFDPKYIQLLKWAKKNGILFSKLRPAVFHDTDRGVMACKKVKSGDCVVSVPHHMLITTRTVEKSCLWARVLKKWQSRLSPRQILCAFLIYEKYRGEKSFWFPYIQTLPTTFNTPAYFTEHELKFVPKSCRQEGELQVVTLRENYTELCKLLEEFGEKVDADFPEAFTFEEFRWAWFAVNTRSVYLASVDKRGSVQSFGGVGGEQDTCALAPVLDLLNHLDTAEVDAGFNLRTQSYEIHSISNYNKGAQVFINYGPHDNKKLFVEYGFVLPKNIHSVFQFNPEQMYALLKPKAFISRRKLDIIKRNSLENDVSCSRENGLSWSLLTILRLLALRERDLDAWEKVLRGCPVSAVNEQTVLNWGLYLIQHALESCSVTCESVSAKTKMDSITVNMKLALRLRSEETSILKQTLVHLNSSRAKLQASS